MKTTIQEVSVLIIVWFLKLLHRSIVDFNGWILIGKVDLNFIAEAEQAPTPPPPPPIISAVCIILWVFLYKTKYKLHTFFSTCSNTRGHVCTKCLAACKPLIESFHMFFLQPLLKLLATIKCTSIQADLKVPFSVSESMQKSMAYTGPLGRGWSPSTGTQNGLSSVLDTPTTLWMM